MQFRFNISDGLAQKGVFIFNQNQMDIPALLYVSIKDVPLPPDGSLIITDKTTDIMNPSSEISYHHSDAKKTTPLFSIDAPLFFPEPMSEQVKKYVEKNYGIDKKKAFVLSGYIPETLNQHQKEPMLFVVSHGLQGYQNSSYLPSFLQKIRSSISPDSMIYMPAIATPQNLSLLIYLGIDLVDTIQAYLAARNHILFFPFGSQHLKKMERVPCMCTICEQQNHDPETYTFHHILKHNISMMEQELMLIHYAIQQENLRELISIRISNHPHLTSILRHAEKDPYHLLEQKTPRYRQSTIKATGLDDLNRPEIKRFQNLLVTKYQKPAHPSVLLLLPCSAKKPYSFSKTHQKFIRTIQSLPHHHGIHQLIITSPLGLVPRDLELLYPASSYDIPVTGEWFEDEIGMITRLLTKYIKQNTYETIIVHLPDPLRENILTVIPNAKATELHGSPSSPESLQSLHQMLTQTTQGLQKISSSQRRMDDMMALSTFQFSKDIASSLLKQTKIKGKYPYLRIMDEEQNQLGMLTETRGMISLTMQGANRIAPFQEFQVEITNDFILKGSVFAPGVKKADPAIRKGDEVLVFQNHEVKAVGVAQMNGSDMAHRMSGKAVDVRHSI